MGYYYKFIRPWDMKVIDEGKYSGMPFFWDIPVEIPLYRDDDPKTTIGYTATGIMDRELANRLQKHMVVNKTLFTDLMDEYDTECLIFRIE